MSDSLTTKVDRTYLDDATRDKASCYLQRTGNGDLLVVLGLAVVPDAVTEDGRARCPACGHPYRADRGTCRRESCTSGPRSRNADVRMRNVCELCGNRLPSHGVCRRSNACREAARERGESA